MCFARSIRVAGSCAARIPVRLLQEASGEALARAAGDPALLARVASLEDAFAADLRRPPPGPVAPERPIAFFCAEYGVHQSLPIYSGGLGALAGDLLKEASDRALPLVAVGLMYRQGYFRQRLDVSGWQQEYWIDIDPERLPAALVRAPDGRPLTITVPICRQRGERADLARGRRSRAAVPARRRSCPRTAVSSGGSPRSCTSLIRSPACRSTRCSASVACARSRRWGSSRRSCTSTRGTRRSRRSSWRAARWRAERRSRRRSEAARQRTVFTTHTPVAAGNETYSREEVIGTLGGLAAELGVDPELLVAAGPLITPTTVASRSG